VRDRCNTLWKAKPVFSYALQRQRLIYTDTGKQVGDVDHLKVFASEDSAERWFAENDPQGVASNTRSSSGSRAWIGRQFPRAAPAQGL
jgi:hypothetical protein